ncbi:MAG TPA: formyltetrahydrofolate deformylase, partial [Acidimicrobiales bacterium]|nr:formyltetrahydrofolate deformylase [Acidimicrobiales bacterium]
AQRARVTASLLLSCRDQPGLVAAVAEFVFRHGGNILHADQHVDHEVGIFFQRVEFDLDGFTLGRDEISPTFAPVAARFDMRCDVRFSDDIPRVAILVSKQPHCLHDLLGRWQSGELRAEIPVVISNHPDHHDAVRFNRAAYEHLPVDPADRAAQEAALLDVLADQRIDLVVLARYMQILSPGFVQRFPSRIINFHHSFVPAFVGAQPYRQAYERGVKLIGATAHYATEELDEGPIIEQDVARVSHRDSVEDLVRKGRDLETVVLARAVRAHLENRVLTYGRKTVVFA